MRGPCRLKLCWVLFLGFGTSFLLQSAALADSHGSFSAAIDQDLLTIEFGTHLLGSGTQTVDFSIHNIGTLPGTLGFDSIGSIGDSTRLLSTVGPFSGLAAGQSLSFQAQLLTDIPGSFSVAYSIDLATDPGGGVEELAIAMFGVVVAQGDFDTDGYVGGNDFLIWQRGFDIRSGASIADGDADDDGDVDRDDLIAWEHNYGNVVPEVSAITAVPEPTALATKIVGLILLMSRRRPGKRSRRRAAITR